MKKITLLVVLINTLFLSCTPDEIPPSKKGNQDIISEARLLRGGEHSFPEDDEKK